MYTPLKILLIEDDYIEAMKFNKVLSYQEIKHTVVNAKDGEEALTILDKKDQLPDVILLDLNMPKINGLEFLKRIKNSSDKCHIPVVILTTSSNFTDLKECYTIGIAGYILKPLTFEEYTVKIENFIKYWSINRLIIK